MNPINFDKILLLLFDGGKKECCEKTLRLQIKKKGKKCEIEANHIKWCCGKKATISRINHVMPVNRQHY